MAESSDRTSVLMGEEDRISKLPDALILHILSFLLTKDVVPTCLLSKRWKFIWYSVPTLSFSYRTYFQLPGGGKKLRNYVENCLEQRKRGMQFIPNSAITSFKLRMKSYKLSHSDGIDKWLAYAVENRVKEITLELGEGYYYDNDGNYYYYYYFLPKTLLVNAKFLTILELMLVELNCSYSFSFPSLKSLTLTLVQFGDKNVVSELLLGSPSLEKLWFNACSWSWNIDYNQQFRIHSSSLKILKINGSDRVEQIEAMNLESLELREISFGAINLSVCNAIKNLSLTCHWCVERSSIEYLISNLPLLENLTLSNLKDIGGLKHIKISSQSVKSFNLNNPFDEEVSVIIESAPNLASLCYIGNIKLKVSMASSNLLNGTFVILERHEKYDGDWFINLINFLLNLNCSWNRVSLHVDSVEALIMPENFKKICRSHLLNWEHLRVFTERQPERHSDLRDALQWISPSLKTLSIEKGKSFKNFELNYR
ncbi:putative F-box/LRR-repeat protein At4g15060 [Cannabis sativa]|uniref:putative F-box/LRR-repeat protein At4g15060 n=1 Tax=Cannabis sativa TaxID=3483 RepID=UPI0029C9FDBF|nr:putative F-box/LRR-repeat protein At4g15060 [Cannabis sativa]